MSPHSGFDLLRASIRVNWEILSRQFLLLTIAVLRICRLPCTRSTRLVSDSSLLASHSYTRPDSSEIVRVQATRSVAERALWSMAGRNLADLDLTLAPLELGRGLLL